MDTLYYNWWSSKKTTLGETASVSLQTGRAERVLVSLWNIYTTEPLKLSFITQITGSKIPHLCSGKLDREWVWVTDPQGRVVWSDQDFTLMLKPVEQTQRGHWGTKDPDSAWCHLRATLVQPKDVHSHPTKHLCCASVAVVYQKVSAGECLTPSICR